MFNKDELLNQIEEYSIILNDYVNEDFIYTYPGEDLENEIKVVSACLLETIEELRQVLISEQN